mmetsp:Transcript_11082/g.27888  ORF Transcript_11082/g.27888 Transcript_11082/m.27888 type:complete len:237 (-) Transcript_11082:495-1205(-)
MEGGASRRDSASSRSCTPAIQLPPPQIMRCSYTILRIETSWWLTMALYTAPARPGTSAPTSSLGGAKSSSPAISPSFRTQISCPSGSANSSPAPPSPVAPACSRVCSSLQLATAQMRSFKPSISRSLRLPHPRRCSSDRSSSLCVAPPYSRRRALGTLVCPSVTVVISIFPCPMSTTQPVGFPQAYSDSTAWSQKNKPETLKTSNISWHRSSRSALDVNSGSAYSRFPSSPCGQPI